MATVVNLRRRKQQQDSVAQALIMKLLEGLGQDKEAEPASDTSSKKDEKKSSGNNFFDDLFDLF